MNCLVSFVFEFFAGDVALLWAYVKAVSRFCNGCKAFCGQGLLKIGMQ